MGGIRARMPGKSLNIRVVLLGAAKEITQITSLINRRARIDTR